MVRTEGEECSKPYDRSAPIVGGCNDPGFSLCRERSGWTAGWEMSTGRAERFDRPSRGRQDSAPEAVRVLLLGGFWVSVGSRTIEQDQWRLRKAASLVKHLAIAPGHRIHREQVMNLLWPDLGRKAASNNLRRVLHAARKVLDSATGSLYLASQDES